MIKKIVVKLILIILLFIFLLIPAQLSFADTGVDTSLIGDPQSSSTMSEFDDIGSIIFGAIQGLGIGISVIVLLIIGIKYMMGSVEEKAEYKKSMIPYIIGVIFLACASSIPNLIKDFNLF